ncbi:uncharacterized protein N7443_001537 [Penicillium atrosanguineum]|uniref:uncharacterized protein n=1 Tax=Penicillium atrosanguineum TaxID=1132637 RepID=UPI002391BBBC|nr:uncharacterized protein N7443_001537 [Penicillium atrosanguineum]KAJ5146862.1 hypothetical protein N7526_000214 [Penicillium atrosanguineum]KAJ5314653.1 hypothetical protein N7443_001537 [Penicillium atrosanguineum]
MASESGFSLHVTIHINPSDLPRWFELFKPVYDAVCQESECRFFELYQSPGEPGTLHWVEDWTATTEWFMETQMTKEYYKEYLAETEVMFVKPREFKILKRVGAPYYMVKDH